jgi:hypothetical protein
VTDVQREASQLGELRVSLSEARAELGRLRADLAPLTGLPALLRAQQELSTLQLKNIQDRIDREVEQHKADVHDIREDIADLMEWRTWALRIIVGAVMVAVVGLVLAGGSQ